MAASSSAAAAAAASTSAAAAAASSSAAVTASAGVVVSSGDVAGAGSWEAPAGAENTTNSRPRNAAKRPPMPATLLVMFLPLLVISMSCASFSVCGLWANYLLPPALLPPKGACLPGEGPAHAPPHAARARWWSGQVYHGPPAPATTPGPLPSRTNRPLTSTFRLVGTRLEHRSGGLRGLPEPCLSTSGTAMASFHRRGPLWNFFPVSRRWCAPTGEPAGPAGTPLRPRPSSAPRGRGDEGVGGAGGDRTHAWPIMSRLL